MLSLIKKAKEKNPDAFAELMQQQMQMMYKIAKSILYSDEDVADAIQDTILACWTKLNSLRDDEYFKTWMTRILVNKCNDLLRRQMPYCPIEQVSEISEPDADFNNLEWNETLKCLDEKYRLIIMLYYIEGFKTSQISRILDIPESTVRTRLARGREKLSSIYLADRRKLS